MKYPHKDIKDTFTIKHELKGEKHYLTVESAIQSNHSPIELEVTEEQWNRLCYSFATVTNNKGTDYLTYIKA